MARAQLFCVRLARPQQCGCRVSNIPFGSPLRVVNHELASCGASLCGPCAERSRDLPIPQHEQLLSCRYDLRIDARQRTSSAGMAASTAGN